MPMDWMTANSRLRETMAVTMELTKLRIPTRAMTMLIAEPVMEEERVSASY